MHACWQCSKQACTQVVLHQAGWGPCCLLSLSLPLQACGFEPRAIASGSTLQTCTSSSCCQLHNQARCSDQSCQLHSYNSE